MKVVQGVVVVVIALVILAWVMRSPSIAGCPRGEHLDVVGETYTGTEIKRCVPN